MGDRRAFLTVCFFAAWLSGCDVTPGARPLTDLGSAGNARVAARFERYRQARENGLAPGCDSRADSHRRVLITGFGPFSGRSQNISGYVADALSNANFFPSNSSLGELVSSSPGPAVPSDSPGPLDAKSSQRTLSFNGHEYSICTVVASVQWDLAAAVFLFEAEKFRPQLIIMTGLGAGATQASLEKGALNQAHRLPGFEADGSASSTLNQPTDGYVLPNAPEMLETTWNPSALAPAATPVLEALNRATGRSDDRAFHAEAAAAIEPRNDYICNNVTFVMLQALHGQRVLLAGNQLDLALSLPPQTAAGFLHYPLQAETSPLQAWYWAHAVLAMAEAHFVQESSPGRFGSQYRSHHD